MDELKDVSANQSPETGDSFLKAEDLRNITLTSDELFEMSKQNICDSIMESMVGVATKNGQSFYATNVLSSMDDKLRNSIVDRFTDLNYEVSLSKEVTHKESGQLYKVLSIGWSLKAKDSK